MKKASEKLTALFEFSSYGNLRGIYLGAESEEDEKILEQGLFFLLRPEKFSSFKRLFRGLR